MIDVELAQQLRLHGLLWTPSSGDRFAVPGRGMDDEWFVVSELTVEVHELPTGRVLGFNGTTEWALDSLDVHDVVWLPHEAQLRDLLGDRFLRLEAGCTVVLGPDEQRYEDPDAERAYGKALLAVLAG